MSHCIIVRNATSAPNVMAYLIEQVIVRCLYLFVYEALTFAEMSTTQTSIPLYEWAKSTSLM